jgi:hypothetical protein
MEGLVGIIGTGMADAGGQIPEGRCRMADADVR